MNVTVKKIRKAAHEGTIDAVKDDADVKELKDRYPKLFDMLTSKGCDDTMLNHLLNLHSRVASGEITQSKGDELFGEHAATKYVYPMVNER